MSAPPIGSGLCEACRHVKRIATAKGSVFVLCARHRTDPRFAKYPRVPVLVCPGFEPAPEAPSEEPP